MILNVPFQPERGAGLYLGKDKAARQATRDWAYFSASTERSCKQFAEWLSSSQEDTRGTVLITGLRGVGKTTFVARALRTAAESMKPRVVAEETKSPSEAANVGTDGKVAKVPRQKKISRPRCLLVVWLDVPRPMQPSELLARLVRKLYVQMTHEGLGHVCPEVVARARAAYLRTLTERTESSESGLKLGAKEISLEASGFTLKPDAELSFLRKTELAYRRNDYDQNEEVLLELVGDMSRPVGSQGIVARTQKSIQERWNALEAWAKGHEDVEVEVVFVLDELDKMEKASDVHKVFGAVKTLLSASSARFVLVGGAQQEAQWLAAERGVDDILASLVSWRIYVPTLQDTTELSAAVKKLTGGRLIDPAHCAVLLSRSGGVPKVVSRLLRTEFKEIDPDKVEPLRPTSYLYANITAAKGLQGTAVHADRPRFFQDAQRAWLETARWMVEDGLYGAAIEKGYKRFGLPADITPQQLASPASAAPDALSLHNPTS